VIYGSQSTKFYELFKNTFRETCGRRDPDRCSLELRIVTFVFLWKMIVLNQKYFIKLRHTNSILLTKYMLKKCIHTKSNHYSII